MKLRALLAVALTSLLVACGGGGGSTAAPSTTISGSVVKGPVIAGIVTVRRASDSVVLGTTTTGSGGAYSLSVPYAGDVIVEATGGTYVDEATGNTTTLATPMRVVLNANGGSVTGVVTPLTTMAFTYAFGGGAAVNAAAFNTMAGNVATQFQLGGINLATTLPNVTGTLNDYGRALRALSQYLQSHEGGLVGVIGGTFTTAQWTAFSSGFSAAYTGINGGTVTFAFDGSTLNVGGTGAGGGNGTCGVNVTGSATVNNVSIPLNFNYCITGIAAASCTSGNASLSQALSGQQGLVGGVNLSYTYSGTCAGNAITINLL